MKAVLTWRRYQWNNVWVHQIFTYLRSHHDHDAYLVCSVMCTSIESSHLNSVRGSPFGLAIRLHGQWTIVFSWSPVSRPFQEDRQFPDRPYPEQRTWTAMGSGVIIVSPRILEVLRHLLTCDQPVGLFQHTIHRTPPSLTQTKPTITKTIYLHARNWSNTSAFHALL